MANEEHLAILAKGVEVWNDWRGDPETWTWDDLLKPDLSDATLVVEDFSGVNFRGANLVGANLNMTNLSGADLWGARLVRAQLVEANLGGANLSGANLSGADLWGARLQAANLSQANLTGASLVRADLTGALLIECNLSHAQLVETVLSEAELRGCRIYGISAWNVVLDGADERDLIVTPAVQPEIRVDNLEIAQFIYLLLDNERIRGVIDTVTSKVVLILGRFTPERKRVLDAIREALRAQQYVPVLFDFDRSADRDITETITLLARMARFIVADLTEPASIPQELQAIAPHVAVPVQPVIEQGRPYSMFRDFWKHDWVLPVHQYDDSDQLTASLYDKVIAPAEAKAAELRRRRAAAYGDS